jgi:hypothetical protein
MATTTTNMTMQECIEQYKASMSDADRIAYDIAIRQLESSFDIEKSIGLLEYIQENQITIVYGDADAN